jgi:hypothetical protein
MKRLISFLIGIIISILVSGQTDDIVAIRPADNINSLKILAIENGEANNLYTIVASNTDTSHYIIKMDEDFNIVWQKQLNNMVDTLGQDYVQMKFHNNSIYLLGTVSDGAFSTYYNLVKISNNGILLWSKKLTAIGGGFYHLPSMEFSNDSNLIIASSSSVSIDIYSLSEDGSVNWIQNFSSDSSEFKNPNFDICGAENGSIIGCAKAAGDISLYSIGSDGQYKWARRLVEAGTYTHVKSIFEVNSNKFLICGMRLGTSAPLTGGFFGFIDSTGAIIDFRVFSELSIIKNGLVMSNGNILLRCEGPTDVFLEIDNTGEIVSANTPPNFQISYYYNSLVEKNGILYIGGFDYGGNNWIKKVTDISTYSCRPYMSMSLNYASEDLSTIYYNNYFVTHTPGTVEDYAQITLDNCSLILFSGCSNVLGIEEQTNSTDVKIYPTLLTSNETIFVHYDIATPVQYQIMDLNGKMIRSNILLNNSISVNDLSNGMYILRLLSNENVVKTTKFVVAN